MPEQQKQKRQKLTVEETLLRKRIRNRRDYVLRKESIKLSYDKFFPIPEFANLPSEPTEGFMKAPHVPRKYRKGPRQVFDTLMCENPFNKTEDEVNEALRIAINCTGQKEFDYSKSYTKTSKVQSMIALCAHPHKIIRDRQYIETVLNRLHNLQIRRLTKNHFSDLISDGFDPWILLMNVLALEHYAIDPDVSSFLIQSVLTWKRRNKVAPDLQKLSSTDSNGRSALDYSIRNGHTKITIDLLEEGVKISKNTFKYVMCQDSSMKEKLDMTSRLIAHVGNTLILNSYTSRLILIL